MAEYTFLLFHKKILMTGTSQTVIRILPLFCFLRLSNLLSQPHTQPSITSIENLKWSSGIPCSFSRRLIVFI